MFAGRLACVAAATVLIVGTQVWVAVMTDQALAVTCSGAVDKHVEGADQQQPDLLDIQGFFSRIEANDFADPQCHTVRSISVVEDVNNLAEVGWRKVDGDGHSHTAFYVWLDSGQYNQEFPGVYPADGSNPSFQLQNSNANQTWAASVNGTVYTPYMFVPGMYHGDFALTNSEKDYNQDSLWAHYSAMKVCTVVDPTNCTYHNPNDMSFYYNNTTGWSWCKTNNTLTWVKEAC